jgi:transposase InsO family protein
MTQAHSRISLMRLCWLFGMSRQAYYQHGWKQVQRGTEQEIILQLVDGVRQIHPRMGGRKLYDLLREDLGSHGIQIGRDALFALLRTNNLLIRKRRRKAITTWSNHPYRKYSNLIKNLTLTAPNQVWVSDITYLKTLKGFVYVSLITDAYSKKIVGYDVASNLESVNALNALQTALKDITSPATNLIHHSDRGIQYCTHDYINLLKANTIRISMTETGDPIENAIAERVNGILKHEYLLLQPIKNQQHAMKLLDNAVSVYNKHRPHLSCNMFTPQEVHQKHLVVKRLWKTYYNKTKKTTFVNPVQD